MENTALSPLPTAAELAQAFVTGAQTRLGVTGTLRAAADDSAYLVDFAQCVIAARNAQKTSELSDLSAALKLATKERAAGTLRYSFDKFRKTGILNKGANLPADIIVSVVPHVSTPRAPDAALFGHIKALALHFYANEDADGMRAARDMLERIDCVGKTLIQRNTLLTELNTQIETM